MIRLMVGLGNPGSEYTETRHNAGFDAVDRYASNERFKRKIGTASKVIRTGKPRVILAKPQTFMNNSGEALKALLKKYGLKPSQALIIYDDLDLESGKIRIRQSGGTGGHNGLRSIVSHLGSDVYPRLRIGIGPRPSGAETIEYVLGQWTPEQVEARERGMNLAVNAMKIAASRGVQIAMNEFNNK